MSILNKNSKYWNRANASILGGNSLLSKNPLTILPSEWPTYFISAKDIFITDINNKKYADFSTMGVGTNVLGYSNKVINQAVLSCIKKGNISSLNSFEEVELAEKLLNLNKWAGLVKFARTGGEANTIAIRIARAASGKDHVAICGYHGWHDWYLAANINDKSDALKTHLLPGLDPIGVNSKLKNSVSTFEAGDKEALEKIFKKNKVGVVKMEVQRNKKNNQDFLKFVRKICSKNNAVLIFDECTSGFRECMGGLFNNFKIYPDLAVFGKCLGNGYPITAVVGRKEIMKKASNSFISSTFWSERIGPVAALKTLNLMEKYKHWKYISDFGLKIKKNWTEISKDNDINILVFGLNSMPTFSFINSEVDTSILNGIFTREMLKKGFLATNSVYVSYAHKPKYLDSYLNAVNDSFKTLSKITKKNYQKFLPYGPPIKGFKRLN